MLSVEALNVKYGHAHVLFDVGFTLQEGRALALLGRNGAGKSTTLKAIAGLTPVHSGQVRFRDVSIIGLQSYRICRLGLGYVPEDRRIFTGLSVMENLEVGRRSAAAGGRATWTVERLFDVFPNLAEIRDRSGAEISGGEQQMLTIARTLMGQPACVLLDEPSEGLAPRILEDLAATLNVLKREGLTLLLSEQNLRFASAIADDAAVIETGRIQWIGTMAALKSDDALQKTHLST